MFCFFFVDPNYESHNSIFGGGRLKAHKWRLKMMIFVLTKCWLKFFDFSEFSFFSKMCSKNEFFSNTRFGQQVLTNCCPKYFHRKQQHLSYILHVYHFPISPELQKIQYVLYFFLFFTFSPNFLKNPTTSGPTSPPRLVNKINIYLARTN